MKKRRITNIIVLMLIILICFVSIGYSFLGTDLNIGGIAEVKKYAPPATIPKFSYTGSYEVVQDDDKIISESDYETYTGNWKIRFLTSGTLSFASLNSASNGIDIFLVGGGGGGGNGAYAPGGGGGGGYTKTVGNVQVSLDFSYDIIVGNGGNSQATGGNSSAFDISVNGGKNGVGAWDGAHGGSGGSGGGASIYSGDSRGYDGSNGGSRSTHNGGIGQGFSTREFYEIDKNTSATLYSTGGNGVGGWGGRLGANTGNGGDGGTGASGGGGNAGNGGDSGIVIIRNARPKVTYQIKDMTFDYTGDLEMVNDADEVISNPATYEGNWKIRFLTSGILKFVSLGSASNGIDVFLVGGGGGGGYGVYGTGGAGGGGYTATYRNITLEKNTGYSIVIGAGGDDTQDGGSTSAFNQTVAGGGRGKNAHEDNSGGNGGSGGGAQGPGGVDGGDGICSWDSGLNSKGQGTTTREFGEAGARLYASGGTGRGYDVSGGDHAVANTGDGGNNGGPNTAGRKGGSGIVIIRNKR